MVTSPPEIRGGGLVPLAGGRRAAPARTRAVACAYLLGALPDYMVPAVFQRLGALPLTQTGKVDRRALPAPLETATAARRAGSRRRRPRSRWRRCGAICSGSPRSGLDDDFFALGGHSLLATRLLAAAAGQFRGRAAVAAVLRAADASAPWPTRVAARTATEEETAGGGAAAGRLSRVRCRCRSPSSGSTSSRSSSRAAAPTCFPAPCGCAASSTPSGWSGPSARSWRGRRLCARVSSRSPATPGRWWRRRRRSRWCGGRLPRAGKR